MATLVRMTKSPFMIETDKGQIELTKGMYLAMLKRRSQKKTAEKPSGRQFRGSNDRTAKRALSRSKTISKATTKRLPRKLACARQLKFCPASNEPSYCPIYEDSQIFNEDLEQYTIPMAYDNDCDTDDEEITASIGNMRMCIGMAIFDRRFEIE